MEEIKTTQAMQHDKSKVMTVPQFMKEYQMGHNKAYEIIHAKGFPCIFMGRKCLIIRSLVDEWFEKHIGERF